MAKVYNKEAYEKLAGSPADLVIPEGYTEICDHGFEGCTSLATMTILNPKIKFVKASFEVCKAITTVNLAKGLTWSKVKSKFKDSPWSKTNPKTKKN